MIVTFAFATMFFNSFGYSF